MTSAGSGTDAQIARRSLSIVILGADAVLAAAPATPVQLAHACLQAGYDAAVPVSWGDELIASAVLRELQARERAPVVQCSCPLTLRRLLATGVELRPFLLSVVPPPVATARYLRAVHAERRLRITYVGRCPGAADIDIDAHVTPEELLAVFEDRQVSLGEQPTEFDDIIPPDRRRFHSLPGGVPRPEALRAATGRELVEVQGGELSLQLGQLLLEGGNVLVDVGPALGCVCAGACAGTAMHATDARARVAAVEPPLATGPVLDESVAVAVLDPLPGSTSARFASEIATAVPVTPAADLWVPPDSPELAPISPDDVGEAAAASRLTLPTEAAAPGTRRRSPAQGIRTLASTTPIARDADGRQLPRAYIAHRRSSPRGMREMAADTSSTPSDIVAMASLDGGVVDRDAQPCEQTTGSADEPSRPAWSARADAPPACEPPVELPNGSPDELTNEAPDELADELHGAAQADGVHATQGPSPSTAQDEPHVDGEPPDLGIVLLSVIGGTLDALINRLLP